MKKMMRCLGCMEEYESQHGLCPYCGYEPGTPTGSPLHMMPGSVVSGRYLVGRSIGSGGFGVTYIGWDEVLRQKVAIKEYLPSEFATRAHGQTKVTVFGGNKAQQFTDGMKKFVDEAQRLARFQAKDGIVRVYDSFEGNNTAYIVMEHLEGETLTAYLEREGKLLFPRAVEMLTPAIRSLEEVHQAGIIHRDIAPDNIFLTRDGKVKLIDFGAARYATTSHSRSLTVIVKPGYSPEEQYRSRGDQGPHTDLYALGAVLYRMVTGETPPDALERRANLENRKKDILVPPSKLCELSRSQENAILNAMNVRIEDRTSTAAAFLAELTSPTPVQRIVGRIKAIDPMKWPLWAKIGIPVGAAVVACLLALLLTGRIGFVNELVTTITLGEDMTRVPSVVNQTADAAEERLTARFLSVMIAGREVSDEIPADMVLRQSVDAGDVVARGTKVDLYISAAAEPLREEGRMPNLIYYEEDAAVEILNQLEAAPLVEYEHHDTIAAGLVTWQSVPEGEVLQPGSQVILRVSLGAAEAPASSNTPETSVKVSLSSSSLSIRVGKSAALTASGASSYSWSSSDPGVAAVSNGMVTAKAPGTAVITATSGGSSASCTVTVTDYQPSLNVTSLSLESGGSATLEVRGVPTAASVTWSSGDPSVAAVSRGSGALTGTVYAQGAGSTTITAQITAAGRNYSVACPVTVTVPVVPVQITLSRTSIDPFYIGEAVVLTATTQPDGHTVTWKSLNPGVATVDETGKVKATGLGRTQIIASVTSGGATYTAKCNVTVSELDVYIE